MKKIAPQRCRILYNKQLDTRGYYFGLRVAGFTAPKKIIPGQFVHVKVCDGVDPYFRRAFSIADFDTDGGELEIIYKIFGKGTSVLAERRPDELLDLIGPLGNSFPRIPGAKTVVIVAGGVGVPPLKFLADHLIERGHDPQKILFFYGGRSKDDLIEVSRIRKLGLQFIPCTDDGSFGAKGFVTGAVEEKLKDLEPSGTVIIGCGPEPMLAALQDLSLAQGFSGQVSLEAPMPCGVGVCLGCIKPLLADPKKYVRVCHDGPVFNIGEVKI